jgi:CitMHS family citrate-Mg2+:H+ or citrate-Ca2+:H+ symporter
LVTAAISLIAPLGDALPPTALIGRLITSKLNLTDSYGSFLKKTMVPWVVITITALAMIFFA